MSLDEGISCSADARYDAERVDRKGYKSDVASSVETVKERGRLAQIIESRRFLLVAVGMLFLAAISTLLAVALAVPHRLVRDHARHGCHGSLPGGKVPGMEYNMTYQGDVNRNWLLFIPPDYSTSEPNPVVFSYHGGGRTPERQRDLDLLETPGFNTKFIVVYPRGIEGRWEGTPDITPRDDVGYTNDILDELESTLCIDTRRVYMTGKSNGGGFVGFSACHHQLSTRFAAFAPVAGSFYIDGESGCNPFTVPITCDKGRDAVPVMEIHGGKDETIRYAGESNRRGSCLPAISHWVEEWAARDGVEDEENDAPRRANSTGSAEVYTWGPKVGDFGLVTHIYNANLSHSWPSRGANADNGPLPDGNGDGPASFDATPVILDFFRGHPLPG